MDDDSITFKIYPDPHFQKGYAMLLCSYADATKFEKLGWNMEKPNTDGWKENRIFFKSKGIDGNRTESDGA